MYKKIKENKAITLIALVITIIVLLILAGVSIAMLTGENGILNQANKAKKETEYKGAEEKVKLAVMGTRADDGQMTLEELEREIKLQGGTIEGGEFPVIAKIDGHNFIVELNGEVEKPSPVPEGLEIGTTVKYTPSGTYNWKTQYGSTTLAEDKMLNSAETDFRISEWKVLDIQDGKVTLVPTAQTLGTVYLGEAQGYNNGVKLLNDACNSLYGNETKCITARSLNVKDIEKYMTEESLASAHEHTNAAKYGEQVSSEYTSNKNYPVMYARENLSVINGETKKTNGLGMSEQTLFIDKTENGATDGKITTATSIQPYQTYWYKDNTFMQTAFKTATNGINYYNLIMPKGSNTTYWLASRCIITGVSYCGFNMCFVNSASMDAYYMCGSDDFSYYYNSMLFPIVSLSSKRINGDTTTGFSVQ